MGAIALEAGQPHAPQARTRPEAAPVAFGGQQFPCARIAYDRGEEIFGEGEPAAFVYKVLAGAVRTSTILADGRRQIDAFFLEGQVFGLETGEAHRFNAEAIVPSRIALVDRGVLQARAQRDLGAARSLLRLTEDELRRTQGHLLLLARKTALQRVASFLLDMAARARQPQQVALPMSRIDIADYLGLTIETVSRMFTQLHRENCLTLLSPREVAIDDPARLAALAE